MLALRECASRNTTLNISLRARRTLQADALGLESAEFARGFTTLLLRFTENVTGTSNWDPWRAEVSSVLTSSQNSPSTQRSSEDFRHWNLFLTFFNLVLCKVNVSAFSDCDAVLPGASLQKTFGCSIVAVTGAEIASFMDGSHEHFFDVGLVFMQDGHFTTVSVAIGWPDISGTIIQRRPVVVWPCSCNPAQVMLGHQPTLELGDVIELPPAVGSAPWTSELCDVAGL